VEIVCVVCGAQFHFRQMSKCVARLYFDLFTLSCWAAGLTDCVWNVPRLKGRVGLVVRVCLTHRGFWVTLNTDQPVGILEQDDLTTIPGSLMPCT
jgi:hypothetical protein